MTTLAHVLLAEPRREALTRDFVELVETHVARRTGFRGITLRTGLAAVRTKVPDAIPRSVTRLLPELVAALEPLYAEFKGRNGTGFDRFLKRDPMRVAETVLTVADTRVERSTNAALKSFYARFRNTAEKEAEALVPGLADVLARYVN